MFVRRSGYSDGVEQRSREEAVPVESDKGSGDPLFGLHKGRGVRRDVAGALDKSVLGAVWRIDRSDSELLRRAKLIYRLDAEFNLLPEAEQRLVLPLLYNTPADREMADLDFQERMDLIRKRYPDKAFSSRTLHRMRTQVAARIAATLNRTAPPFDDDVLGRIVQRERLFAAELIQANRPQRFAELVRKAYDAPMRTPIAAFLALRVFVPRTRDHQLIVGKTSRHGDWVCVFTTEQALSAHPVARRDGGCHTVVAGADIVREVAGKWRTVGIVVDPSAVRSSGDGAAYPTALQLPADLLPTLVGAG